MSSVSTWGVDAGFDGYRSSGWRYLGVIAVLLILVVEVLVKLTVVPAPPTLAASDNVQVSAAEMRNLQTASTDLLGYTGGTPFMSYNFRIAKGTGPVAGKPTLLYMGSEFCPYCAAGRWPLTLALLRFGQLSSLHYMTSSAIDVYPNTPTFTFYGSTYTSPYLSLQTVEFNTNKVDPSTGYYGVLQNGTTAQQALFTKYDSPPYVTSAQKGAIPFIDIGGRFTYLSTPYVPANLAHKSWAAITSGLIQMTKTDAGNPSLQSIAKITNQFTAAICQTTGGKPANVCTAKGVVAAASTLPTRVTP